MNPKVPTLAIATASIVAAIVVVWIKWTYFPPPSYYFSDDIAAMLACIFVGAIVAGFGAAIPRRRTLRILFQGASGVLLIAFVALPVNPTWYLPTPEVIGWRPGPIPGKPREESQVTIRAIPVFKIEKSLEMMVLPGSPPIEILCHDYDLPLAKAMPRNRELLFTVWRTKRVFGHLDNGEENYIWSDRLETIRDGEAMLYDARICPLHKVEMTRAEVAVKYGLPTPAFLEAYSTFSGGPGFILGGCVVSDISEKKQMAYRCTSCVDGYAKWAAQ